MKKLVVAMLIATLMIPSVAMASDADYEARIAELERRVAALEEMLGVSSQGEAQSEASLPASTDTVSLGIGTWIVGEDIPAGKYNLTCPDGTSYVKIYKSYEDRINEDYSYIENYNVTSPEYVEALFEALGEDQKAIYGSMYPTSASNIRLEDGFCLYIEDATADFTPVQ